jgi:PadR family transcriptional regulator AphA
MKENTSYYVILGILSLGECSGYDIKKKIGNAIGYFYKVSNGQIYPVLKKLVSQKYADFRVEKSEGKPYRKVYSITDQGFAVLKEWLDSRDNQHNNELLLKLYFGSVQPISKNIQMIDEYKKIKEKHLEAYDNIAAYFNPGTINTPQEYYSYFTLRFGQVTAKAYIDWCSEVESILQEMDKEK